MTLPAIAPFGVCHPNGRYCPGARMTGNAVFPHLQGVRNRWWSTWQKGAAKAGWADGFPACLDKEFLSFHLGVTLITERVFRVWCHRHKFTEFRTVAALGMT